MHIGARAIGPGQPVYVIAELGVNHDGSVERALEMVEGAASAGADAVKVQWFRAGMLMSGACRLAAYQAAAGERDPIEMLSRLELSGAGMARIVRAAKERDLDVIATVFSVQLVPDAEKAGFDAYKTASPDLVHRPLLEALMGTGKPMIVSTGAAELNEVRRAVSWLEGARSRLALLQCVSSYPTGSADAEIGAMLALSRVWDGPVGYSDHTSDVDTGAVAALLGASVLEKHLTYDRAARGPDHAASLDAKGFAEYVALVRNAAAGRGDLRGDPRVGSGEKRVLACERDVRSVSRQSITAVRALKAGERLAREDVVFKRPGTGLEPWRIDDVIGARLARDVAPDMPVSASDLEGVS